MESFNRVLFGLINAPAVPDTQALLLARFFAEWLIYLVAAAMIAGWVRGGPRLRQTLIFAGLAALVGLGANRLIAGLWFHPRPFEIGIGTQFLAHAPDASFPSDHGTILFAIAFALSGSAGAGLWGLFAMLVAAAVAWARVYLGVHWPLDMVGSAVVAALSSALVLRGLKVPAEKTLVITVSIYDRVLERLHLPEVIFPRSGHGR